MNDNIERDMENEQAELTRLAEETNDDERVRPSTNVERPPIDDLNEARFISRTSTPNSHKSPTTPTTPTTRANLEPTATVKYLLVPINQVVTIACSLKMAVHDLREQISTYLNMKAEHLILYFFDETIQNDVKIDKEELSLSDLKVHPNGIVQFKVVSVDQDKYPIAYEPKEKYLSSPDFITVRLNQADAGPSGYKMINVEIERLNVKKPFLGGYKNKLTNKEYLNASAQTNRIFKPDNGIEKFSRDTQTVVSKHLNMQTRQDMATQMTKPGVFVSRLDDKLVTPRPYQTAEQREKIRIKSVVIIQKYFRRWQAKKRFVELKLAYDQRIKWEKEKEAERIRNIEERRQYDINRRLNPKTKDDFEILYAALEKWRMEEMAHINATKTGAARKAALAMLVDQEAELIATIERYKIDASTENKEKKIQYLLEKMSKPKIWKYKDGTTTELDTPYNIRARELRDIYNSLNMSYLTQDERLDVLLTLKHTIKEHDCKLTQDIISLIDREADLLMRGIKEENLQGLRKRISTLFLQYIKTPQFNPAAARVLKVPQDLNLEKVDTFYCTTCQSYLPSHEFLVSSSNTKIGKCRNCRNVENIAIKRIDYTKFKHMLTNIQQDEQKYGGKPSTICYLLSEKDVYYLFETIWNSQSVLSSNQDIYQLHFVRWNKEEAWTPWNTILLTTEEANSHLKLTNLELNYGDTFIKKIKQKHVMAKNHFLKLPYVADHLQGKYDVQSDLRLPSLTGIKIAN